MKKPITIRAVVTMILAVGSVANVRAATTWTVDPGGGGDFTTIQAAINGAGPSDTINIVAGTYAENLVINNAGDMAITLVGAGNGSNPVSDTIVQGVSANSDTIHIVHGGTAVGQRVLLSNMRVTGGQGAGNLGMGVEIGGSGDVSHITFDNFASVGNGGNGIGLNHVGPADDIVVTQSLLANNGGGGFRVPASMGPLGTLSISQTTIEDNSGIGFIAYTPGTISVSDSIFSGNASGLHTGGDLVMTGFVDGDLTLNGVTFTSDNADVAIRVSGSHDGGSPRMPVSSATISMTDVTISGTQFANGSYPSAAIVISRLQDLTPSDITFDNVVINSTADFGLFLGTVTDSAMDLDEQVAFGGTFSQYAIALGRHGNSSSYAWATIDVDAIGLGLAEADVWDFDDDSVLGDVSVISESALIPEPATMSLLAIGGLGAVARRRRRRGA